MTITAFSGLAPEKYIPRSEREEDSPAEFTLKPLNGLEYMEVIGQLINDEDLGWQITGRGLRIAISYGVIGWTEFNDADGKEIKFSKNNVKLLPSVILGELADKIINISEIGEAERKN